MPFGSILGGDIRLDETVPSGSNPVIFTIGPAGWVLGAYS